MRLDVNWDYLNRNVLIDLRSSPASLETSLETPGRASDGPAVRHSAARRPARGPGLRSKLDESAGKREGWG